MDRVWQKGGEVKSKRALEIRDEENTKSENVNTNEPFRPEGSRVVQYQNLLNFQFFHGSPAPT